MYLDPSRHLGGYAALPLPQWKQPMVRRLTFELANVAKRWPQAWYRALTWYFLYLSSPRTHFEPWKAVGTRGRDSLAAR